MRALAAVNRSYSEAQLGVARPPDSTSPPAVNIARDLTEPLSLDKPQPKRRERL
jgi:hypothetical protein